MYKAPQFLVNDFPMHLDNELLCSQSEMMMVIGDFNIDRLRSDGSTERLQSVFWAKSFSQCVSTHTTDHGSLLDHIWVNFDTNLLTTSVLKTYYSDHFPMSAQMILS
jgi:endonuclease/exonuclease/phosphatase (EEP) superfamily protein YafD